MSLRDRLTLLFTAIVSVLLALFCLILYYFAEQYRDNEFQKRLKAEAMTAGHMLVGRERIGPALYKLMDKNQLTVLPQEEIIIYNANNKLVYESGTDFLAVQPATLDKVRQSKVLYWQEGNREIMGVLFTEDKNQPPHVIFASSIDTYGSRMTQKLSHLLLIGWLFMTGFMLAVGNFFAGRSLRPFGQINQRIDEITASNLSLRLPEPQGLNADELTQLAQRFNRMLNRLEDAFRLQRSFVSHASHELRTPLTAITGQLEVSLLADDDPDELKATIHSVLDDVRGLNRMVNGLLSLANANMDASAIAMTTVQLDGLLEKVCQELQRMHPAYSVSLKLMPPDAKANDWQLQGNEALLRTAFFNLLENGGKFSPDHSLTATLTAQTTIELTVWNMGPAIPADQLSSIFTPFQRGRNASGKPGYGIGLPLSSRIVELHNGQLLVESSEQTGTLFTVKLPRQ